MAAQRPTSRAVAAALVWDLVRRDRDQLTASHIGDAEWRGLRKGEIAANVNVTKVGRDCLGSKQYSEVCGKVVGM